MPRIPFHVLASLLLAILLPLAAVSAHAAAMPEEEIEEEDARLAAIKQALEAEAVPDRDALRAYLGEIPVAREVAAECIERNESRLANVEESLETLGASGPHEAAGVQQQRATFQVQRRDIESQLQLCRVIQLRANQLQDRVTRLQQTILTARLTLRERLGGHRGESARAGAVVEHRAAVPDA